MNTSRKTGTLRRRAAKPLTEQGASSGRPQPQPDRQRLRHELDVYHVELTAQNDELLRVQHDLESAQNQYCELYDLAPMGHVSLDPAWVILKANLTTAMLLGVERGQLIGRPMSDFIDPSDRDVFFLHCRTVLSVQTRQSCCVTVLKPDGDGRMSGSTRTPLRTRMGTGASAS